MVLPESYEIEIKPVSEKPLENVDRVAKIGFKIKNLDKENEFPGMNIYIGVTRSGFESLGVSGGLAIPPLGPNEEKTEYIKEKPVVPGGMAFSLNYPSEIKENKIIVYNYAINKVPVYFYLADGRKISHGQLIHILRVKSQEEINSLNANYIASGSLTLLVLFQILDWFIKLYLQYH